MKMYERIENNNFEEIDKDRAIELIKNGNGHLVYNQSYFDLQKENEELKSVKKECVFREDGTEECLWHCSNCNKEWLFYEGTPEDNELKYCPHCGAKVTKYENYIEGEIEVANKMEEDLIEKLQKENEELKNFRKNFVDVTDKELKEANDYFSRKYTFMGDELAQHINTLLKVTSNSIPVQKVKDKIEKLNRKINNGGKTYGRYGGCVINSENIMKLQNQIEALKELLEGRK